MDWGYWKVVEGEISISASTFRHCDSLVYVLVLYTCGQCMGSDVREQNIELAAPDFTSID